MSNKETKIRFSDSTSEETNKNLIQSLSPISKLHFHLAIGDAVDTSESTVQVSPIQQEKSKKGVYQLLFDLKKQTSVKSDDILFTYPINCTIAGSKMMMSQDQFRRMIQDFKRVDQNSSSDESSNSEISDFRSDMIEAHDNESRGRGRPRGSRNKKKISNQESSSDQSYQNSSDKRTGKRGRGRPKGAKNKKKIFYDNIQNQSNFHTLFKNLFQNRTVQELAKKINKSKKKDIKKEQDIDEKNKSKTGKKGRPLGARNKKNNSRESDSEDYLNFRPHPRSKTKKYPKCCNKCGQREKKREFLQGKEVSIAILSNLSENVGVEDTENLIINSIKKNEPEILNSLLEYVDKKDHKFIVPWVCSQRLQKVSYTVRTRKQYVSKHQRQGNNALLQDCYASHEKWWRSLTITRILQNIPKYESGKQIYEILIKKEPELEQVIYENLPTLIRSGNDTLAYHLLTKLVKKQENSSIYGYSRDHLECLNPERTELYLKKSSMLKQNCTSNFCSPIHCAVINQKTQLLEYILKHTTEFNVGDSLCRKPIHYAAVLETVKPMDILCKYGADLKELDKKKMTPLMLAAQFGSYNVIKFILEKVREPLYINFKGEQGLSALHYATIYKNHQCLQLLLNDPLVDKNSETKEKFTILHLSAGNGSLDAVRMIIDKGVQFTNDCFRRSPLVIALRNHYNDIFFQLLQQNQTISKKDYSNNTLLHYAASYGNIQIVTYLANVLGSERNKKNFYPWQLAILKGHLQCAKRLYDKNLSLERHLLLSILKNPRGTDEYINIIKYLLDANLYQIDYQNSETGNTCLHLVCGVSEAQYNRQRKRQSSFISPNEYEQMQSKLIRLFIDHGANTKIKNQKGKTPVDLCIDNENLIGVQLLLTEIPFQTEGSNKVNKFIHYLTNLACRGKEQMKFVHQKLVQVDERKLKVQLKEEWNGFTFLVYLIKKFTETVHINFRKTYIRYMSHPSLTAQEKNDPNVQKQFIQKSFEEYVEHQENLIQLINFLISHGAQPTSKVLNPKLQNQQQNFRIWGIPHFLMKFPSLKLLRMLIKWLDKAFTSPTFEGKTPLHLFCMWNRQGCIFNSIHTDMAPVPFIDFTLHEDYEGLKCLQYLLEKGFYSIAADGNKSTPLLYAALNGQLNFMNSLRIYGSPMNNCNSLNQVPLIEIIKLKQQFTIQQIESVLCADNSLNLDIDIRDLDERNVLHHLVANAKNFDFSPELCKKLLDYGININSIDKYGRSPIFYCFIKIQYEEDNEQQNNSNDKVQILQTLLHHKDIALDIKDIYQRTPLHYACQKNSFFSILYLLDKNINYHIEDREGNTPLAICLKHRNLNQAALLIKKGVKHGYVKDQGHKYSYFAYASTKLSVGICFMLIDEGYPLQNALEEVKKQSFKRVLTKKYL